MKFSGVKFLMLLLAFSPLLLMTSCGEDINGAPFCSNNPCPDGYTCDEINRTCISEEEYEAVSGEITSNTTWTNDRIWRLTNKVVVQSGVTLTIEPGTIIKGREGSGSLATALIIAKGDKIMADGTADAPIIFTSTQDNIGIGQKSGTNLTASDRGLWGGLIVLGNAKASTEDNDITGQIEGVPADIPNTTYGGDDDTDNSGIIRYVSIRHGGAIVSEGNEINGLTLGAVGSGTTIEYVEVLSNSDDGIECFGGSVNIRNTIVAYQKDDAYDIDQNYSGEFDNLMVIQDDATGETDEAMEIDGPEGSTYTNGMFTIKNGTFKTFGGGSGADLKSKAQGQIINCSFEGYADAKFIKVRTNFDTDASCELKSDAYSNMLLSNTLTVMGCDMITSGADLSDVYTKVDDCSGALTAEMESNVDTYINENNATVSTSSKGADTSVFAGWTWLEINGKL